MRKTLLPIILIVICSGLTAQSTESHKWFTAGVGAYGSRNSSGFGVGASYDLKKIHHFKLRIISVGEFTLMSAKEPDAYTEAGMLFSHIFGKEWFRITASGGLGFLAGKKIRETYNMGGYDSVEEKLFAPAIPLELSMDVVGKHAGVGLAGFANINPGNSISGLIFRISFGRIR